VKIQVSLEPIKPQPALHLQINHAPALELNLTLEQKIVFAFWHVLLKLPYTMTSSSRPVAFVLKALI